MYASPSSPLSTHRSGLVSCSNMYCIDPKLESKPVPENHTFPTYAPHPLRPRAHIHYGNDGLLASHRHDRMSQVAEQRLSDYVST